MNPNDAIRWQILKYFYTRNQNATSRMGKKGSAVKISDIKRELKAGHGLKQQEVMANLTYLIDNAWVKTLDIEKTVKVKGGTIPQVTTFYEITAKGIDKVEGGSQFEPKEKYAGINITATGKNIITLGDGNVVNAEFSELNDALTELKEAITVAHEINESEKLSLAADIESIKDQLAKPQPNRSIIRMLWDGLAGLSSFVTVADALQKAGQFILPLLQ